MYQRFHRQCRIRQREAQQRQTVHYNAVSGLLDSTNTYIQQAQQAEVDFALGNMTNTHELGVYQQKANMALQYTVAIRDKALEAYKEIMNMSI